MCIKIVTICMYPYYIIVNKAIILCYCSTIQPKSLPNLSKNDGLGRNNIPVYFFDYIIINIIFTVFQFSISKKDISRYISNLVKRVLSPIFSLKSIRKTCP